MINLPGLYDRIPRILPSLPSSAVDPDPNSFNPRRIGAAIAMLLPLSVVLFLFGRRRWDRLLALAALIIGGLVLLLSQAIMGLFGLAVALLLIGLWWRRWLFWVALAGLLALVAVIVLNDPRQIASTLLDINHPAGIAVLLRLDMWSRALAMITDRPFTGVGLDNFPLVQTNFYIGQHIGPEPHAHNLFLQTLADLGVFGLLALLWLMLAFALTVVHAYKTTTSRDMQVLLLGLAAGVLAFFVGGLLDVLALGDRPTLFLWVILGLATAIASVARRQAASENGWWSLATSRWLLVVPAFLILLALLLFPSARQRNLSLIAAQQLIYESRTEGTLPAFGIGFDYLGVESSHRTRSRRSRTPRRAGQPIRMGGRARSRLGRPALAHRARWPRPLWPICALRNLAPSTTRSTYSWFLGRLVAGLFALDKPIPGSF